MNREIRSVLILVNAMLSDTDRAIVLEFIEKYDGVGGRQASISGVEELRHMRDLFSGTISIKSDPDPKPWEPAIEFLSNMRALVKDLRLEYQDRNKKPRGEVPDRVSRILRNIAELQEAQSKTLA